MTVQELRARRRKLETDLQTAIAQLVSEFQDETAFAPSGITVDLIDVSDVSRAPERQMIVGQVNVRVDL